MLMSESLSGEIFDSAGGACDPDVDGKRSVDSLILLRALLCG
jgi:hypothetical protein